MVYTSTKNENERRVYRALSSQILFFLKALYEIEKEDTGSEPSGYIFSFQNKVIANNMIKRLIMAMGYDTKKDLTAHGIRASFLTIMNEHRSEHKHGLDIIDMCLAHKQKNAVISSYNHAKMTKERRDLLQFWGDNLGDIIECDSDIIQTQDKARHRTK